MKKKSSNYLAMLLCVFFLSDIAAAGSLRRIRSVSVDKGEVQTVMMVAGLASVLIFPCDVDEAVIGRQEDLKVNVSPTSKRQLTLSLAKGSSLPTNMVVRCGDKRDPFVFDVIPSRSSHQDVLRIRSSFGGPELEDISLSLIESSQGPKARERESATKRGRPRVLVLESPKLIEEAR